MQRGLGCLYGLGCAKCRAMKKPPPRAAAQ